MEGYVLFAADTLLSFASISLADRYNSSLLLALKVANPPAAPTSRHSSLWSPSPPGLSLSPSSKKSAKSIKFSSVIYVNAASVAVDPGPIPILDTIFAVPKPVATTEPISEATLTLLTYYSKSLGSPKKARPVSFTTYMKGP